jgi:hypothetical protein
MTANELNEFYNQILGCIETYGLFTLKDAHGRQPWPKQGVYFFFDTSEPIPSPDLPGRIVRIGSHGVAQNTNSTLWMRLKQHQGSQTSGGGNHRGSIFRQYVGIALKGEPSRWRDAKAKYAEVSQDEHAHECLVSDYIRQLPFTVIGIPGHPGKNSQRAIFEGECISYISWAAQNGLIKMRQKWLGLQAEKEEIKKSGLWNVRDVWSPGQAQPCVPTWPPIV